MKRALLFGFSVMLILTSVVCAQPESKFNEGLQKYRANDMPGAIAAWKSIMHDGEISGPLLYNLGNAHYKAGEIGKAILFYERAAKLMPRDHDLKSNLDLVKLATVDKIESPVRLAIWDWLDFIRNLFNTEELARIFYMIGFLSTASIFARLFWPTVFPAGLRILFISLLTVWILIGGWYFWKAAVDSRAFGVVIVSKTDITSAPDTGAKTLFSLHEGTKVRIGERLSSWINVQLADGRKGWLQRQDVETI
jgi:hypothetical protein